MQKLPVQYTILNDKARSPEYGVSGISLFAVSETLQNDRRGSSVVYDTGIEFNIPEGFIGLIYLDNSVATSTTLTMQSSPYVITSEHIGSVKLTLKNFSQFGAKAGVGSKIAEMIVIPQIHIQLEEVAHEQEAKREVSDRTLQGSDQTIEKREQATEETAKGG